MRINVVGTSGSGKSTFSKKLAERLSIPYIEMDAVFWGSDWYWPPDEEFFANLRNALAGEHWVLDGNYTRTIPIKWEVTDVVIWLDFSFARALIQAIKRATQRVLSKDELWSGTGNRETFRMLFSKDSIVLYTIKKHGKVRKKYEAYIVSDDYAHLKFIRIRSPKEADALIAQLAREYDFS